MSWRSQGITVAWGLWLALGGAGCEDQRFVIGVFAPGQGGGGGAAGAPERPTFDAPTAVTELNSDSREEDPTLTGDLLEIYFMSDRGGSRDIWTSRRAAQGSPWDAPRAVDALNGADTVEDTPCVAEDGLRIWFFSARPPKGIWSAERASRNEPWGTPEHVDALVSDDGEVMSPHVDRSGLRVVVGVEPSDAETYIAIASRERPEDAWSALAPLAGLDGPGDEHAPFLFDDGRQILFRSSREGGGDLFWARREAADAAFEEAESLGEPLNLPEERDTDPHLSPDGSVLFFASTRSGVADLYEARRVEP
ncbi:TolB family protein [Sorangium sp. So ce1000]|uniref:TolB family protein n=1 Tax=Sorangium sp. So ce1000 TaxID=3133325 RepID=UPI003F5FCEAD